MKSINGQIAITKLKKINTFKKIKYNDWIFVYFGFKAQTKEK